MHIICQYHCLLNGIISRYLQSKSASKKANHFKSQDSEFISLYAKGHSNFRVSFGSVVHGNPPKIDLSSKNWRLVKCLCTYFFQV